MREKLRLHCAPVQLPLGLEDGHRGLVDLVAMRAFHFEGPNGETITEVGGAFPGWWQHNCWISKAGDKDMLLGWCGVD